VLSSIGSSDYIHSSYKAIIGVYVDHLNFCAIKSVFGSFV